jgi:hypothetical protein
MSDRITVTKAGHDWATGLAVVFTLLFVTAMIVWGLMPGLLKCGKAQCAPECADGFKRESNDPESKCVPCAFPGQRGPECKQCKTGYTSNSGDPDLCTKCASEYEHVGDPPASGPDTRECHPILEREEQ